MSHLHGPRIKPMLKMKGLTVMLESFVRTKKRRLLFTSESNQFVRASEGIEMDSLTEAENSNAVYRSLALDAFSLSFTRLPCIDVQSSMVC